MTQATGAVSFRNCAIELSTDNTNWSNISGWSNSISIDGGDRQVGEFFTLDGDTPILTPGKRNSFDLTTKVVYTEGASDPYTTFLSAYEGGTPLYLRWAPKGLTAGNFQFTTGPCIVTTPAYPTGEAGSPDAVAFEFKLKVLTVAKGVVAP